MWTCPKCGAKVDLAYEVSWRCRTSTEGVEDQISSRPMRPDRPRPGRYCPVSSPAPTSRTASRLRLAHPAQRTSEGGLAPP